MDLFVFLGRQVVTTSPSSVEAAAGISWPNELLGSCPADLITVALEGANKFERENAALVSFFLVLGWLWTTGDALSTRLAHHFFLIYSSVVFKIDKEYYCLKQAHPQRLVGGRGGGLSGTAPHAWKPTIYHRTPTPSARTTQQTFFASSAIH